MTTTSRLALSLVLLSGCGPAAPRASSGPPAAAAPAAQPAAPAPAPVRRTVPRACVTNTPADPKVSPMLEPGCFDAMRDGPGLPVAILVVVAPAADPAQAKRAAEAAVAGATARVHDDRSIGGVARLLLDVATPAEVTALAALDEVTWIEPAPRLDEDG